MRTNRETDANVIVFDEDSMDATVAVACAGGLKFIQAVGLIVIVSTQRGNFSNLAVVYSISREMAKTNIYAQPVDGQMMTMIVERLLYLLNDYKPVEKEVTNIQKSADKIKASLDKVSQYIGSTAKYLKHFLESGELSEKQLLEFYQGHSLALINKKS